MERSPGQARYAQHRDEQIGADVEKWDATTKSYVVWDLSPSDIEVRFRAYTRPPGSKAASDYEVDTPLSKVAGGSGGRVLGMARFPLARALVECEIVVVETAFPNAATPSGSRETQVKLWDARVEAALLA